MFKKLVMSTAMAAAFGLATSANAGLIGFDPDGAAGGFGTMGVSGFDWAPGAILFDNMVFDGDEPEAGAPAFIRMQGFMNLIQGPDVNPGTLGVGEFTFQAQVPVQFVSKTTVGAQTFYSYEINDNLLLDPDFFDPTRNFFKIYHDTTQDVSVAGGNNATTISGCGYGADQSAPCVADPNEKLIFQALFDPAGDASTGTAIPGVKTITLIHTGSTVLEALDQFNGNSFVPVANQRGTLASADTADLETLFDIALGAFVVDTDYFKTAVDRVGLVDQTNTINGVTPFTKANPNAQIVGVTPDYGAAAAADLSAAIPGDQRFVNNLGCEGAAPARNCDVQMEHDVALTFDAFTFVPEPGSVALLGLGLSGLAVAGMRRRRKS